MPAAFKGSRVQQFKVQRFEDLKIWRSKARRVEVRRLKDLGFLTVLPHLPAVEKVLPDRI